MQTATPLRIGILDCGPSQPAIAALHGDHAMMFARLLSGRGWTFHDWKVHQMEFPPSVTAADAWLLTGSRYGVYEDHAFIRPLETFVRAASVARRPVLGICFGHQLVAQAFGGVAQKSDSGWRLGRQVYAIEGGETWAMTGWHQDQVVTPPPGAHTIAANDTCPYAGFRLGDMVMTLQAHPEFTAAVARDYVRLRRYDTKYPEEVRAAAEEGLSHPLDTDDVVEMMAGFLASGRRQTERASA